MFISIFFINKQSIMLFYWTIPDKYLPSELLATTGLSITANTVTSIIHSAIPALTASATAFIEVTNVFPVVGSWRTQQQQQNFEGQTKSSISQTTITLLESVRPSSTYIRMEHMPQITISVVYDLISVMYYDADALMMDFQNPHSQILLRVHTLTITLTHLSFLVTSVF
ncbi:unnamed protein product [Ambrosiozyma monospora]|uniref:Unnamed protein product n=1 Tax=Ambrosiozyma monospora TaxID=43982 RepID=A0A9W6Z3L2_AMBMO|nr:unnamed protein product [Ambrosiozyma monospora]